MKTKCCGSAPVVSAASLTVVFVLCAAGAALGFCGGPHRYAAEQATWLFTHGVDRANPTCITEERSWYAFYPELLEQYSGWSPFSSYMHDPSESRAWFQSNKLFIEDAAIGADDACPNTLNHFWLFADGLHDDPGLGCYNSWEYVSFLWIQALMAWDQGDLGWAYTNLGYCMHHVQDLLQPAHSNDDWHAGDGEASGDDAIEEWFDEAHSRLWYSWDGSSGPQPGPEIPYPNVAAMDNDEILQDIYNAGIADVGDFPALAQPSLPYNMQKLFYLMYWANQTGNWFASDDSNGNAGDPIGWMEGFPGLPREFGPGRSIHDSSELEDNDTDCDDCTDHCRWDECDADGDLTTICNSTYAAVFKASPALIDLFRRTVDLHHPVTATDVTRADGQPVVEWNNSPVTVRLTGAEDEGNQGFRPSGVWKVWGLCDGNPPADHEAPSWLISEDGKHKIECKSTDWCGNVERANDIDVWIDMTPPEVTFPDLRPNYLTSESFTATWNATDAMSGVASEIAYLDGAQVTNGQVFDLSLMAGVHTLRVIASDNAGNIRDVEFTFEVWIAAQVWAKPENVDNKTKGNGMAVIVEFPAPYDVGKIDLATCKLAVKGFLDLTRTDPITGETARLPGWLLTGVGDHDEDGIPDRMVKFDKEQFALWLGGQVGNVPAVVSGGLLPGGSPRFLGVLTVPVFAPPRK